MAGNDHKSENSAIEVDYITSLLADKSLKERSDATAQRLPASRQRRPRHAEGVHNQRFDMMTSTDDSGAPHHQLGKKARGQDLPYHSSAGQGFQVGKETAP